MEESRDRIYEYRPRWSVILLGIFFFAVGAVVFAAMACWKVPIARFRIMRLPAEATEAFWWCCLVGCLGGVLYCVLLAVSRLTRTQRVIITPVAVIMPMSRWSSAEITIPYMTIRDLSFSQANGQRFLTITHEDGKNTITSWFLSRNEDFEEIRCLLGELVKAAKPEAVGD